MSNLEPQSSNKRHFANLLINPGYQLKYSGYLLLSALLLTVINALIVSSYLRENYTILVALSPMNDASKSQLMQELRQLKIAIGLTSTGFLVLVALIGIVLSHRTAGPLYHFKKVFEEIRKGNKNARIQLRTNDEFSEVAESFNEMMDTQNSSKEL